MKKQNLWKPSIAPFLTATLLCIQPSVAASGLDESPDRFFEKIRDGNCQSVVDEALLLAHQDNIAAQNFLGVAYSDVSLHGRDMRQPKTASA